MDMENLEALKILNKKTELVQELLPQVVEVIAKFANREDLQTLSVNDQLSVIHSTFLSLLSYYRFNQAENIKIYEPDEIQRAQEIVHLEKTLNPLGTTHIERYNKETGIWDTVERKVIKEGDLVRPIGVENSEKYAVKDAVLYNGEWYIQLDEEFS